MQLQIGLCPQFDVLWEDLTVEEHLRFYAQIKGVLPEEEDATIAKTLKGVQLDDQAGVLVVELPLGARRRLSIAISLVSNPKVIFLDEPTTGLDPETRRHLWDILKECNKDRSRALVLTTHSMEEADVLCSRIGIVDKGVVRCLGSQNRLKDLYGGGYHLFINCHRAKTLMQMNVTRSEDEVFAEVERFVGKLLPNAIKLRMFNGQFVYQVPLGDFNAQTLFTEVEGNRDRLFITDWSISQCSLEDVFTRICELS